MITHVSTPKEGFPPKASSLAAHGDTGLVDHGRTGREKGGSSQALSHAIPDLSVPDGPSLHTRQYQSHSTLWVSESVCVRRVRGCTLGLREADGIVIQRHPAMGSAIRGRPTSSCSA